MWIPERNEDRVLYTIVILVGACQHSHIRGETPLFSEFADAENASSFTHQEPYVALKAQLPKTNTSQNLHFFTSSAALIFLIVSSNSCPYIPLLQTPHWKRAPINGNSSIAASCNAISSSATSLPANANISWRSYDSLVNFELVASSTREKISSGVRTPSEKCRKRLC